MLIAQSTNVFDLYMVISRWFGAYVRARFGSVSIRFIPFPGYVATTTRHRLPSRLSTRKGNCAGKSCVANDAARDEGVWQRSLQAGK